MKGVREGGGGEGREKGAKGTIYMMMMEGERREDKMYY